MQAIIDLLGKEAIAAFLGVVVTMVLGFMVARWTFFRHQSKMKRGEFLGQLPALTSFPGGQRNTE